MPCHCSLHPFPSYFVTIRGINILHSWTLPSLHFSQYLQMCVLTLTTNRCFWVLLSAVKGIRTNHLPQTQPWVFVLLSLPGHIPLQNHLTPHPWSLLIFSTNFSSQCWKPRSPQICFSYKVIALGDLSRSGTGELPLLLLCAKQQLSPQRSPRSSVTAGYSVHIVCTGMP